MRLFFLHQLLALWTRFKVWDDDDDVKGTGWFLWHFLAVQIWDCASAPTCDCPPIALWELLCGRANDQALGHMPGPVQYTPIYLNRFSKQNPKALSAIFFRQLFQKGIALLKIMVHESQMIYFVSLIVPSPPLQWQWDNKAFWLNAK